MNILETVLALQEGWLELNRSVEHLEKSNEDLKTLHATLLLRDQEAAAHVKRFELSNADAATAELDRRREIRLVVNRVTEQYAATLKAAEHMDKVAASVLKAQFDVKAIQEQADVVNRNGIAIAKSVAEIRMIQSAVAAVRDQIGVERGKFETVLADVSKRVFTDLGRSLRSELDERVSRALEQIVSTKVKGFRWRGPWNDKETYEEGDIFTASGNSYLVLRRSRGVVPSDAETQGKAPRYGLMAVGGANGQDGAGGGAAGAPGADGAPGAPGANGTDGSTVIASSTLVANGTFSFTGLDLTPYSRVELELWGRCDKAAAVDSYGFIYFNNDSTSANYFCTSQQYFGTAENVQGAGSITGRFPAVNSPAGSVGVVVCVILNPSNTTRNKVVACQGHAHFNTGAGGQSTGTATSTWLSTAAITSIQASCGEFAGGVLSVIGSKAILRGFV